MNHSIKTGLSFGLTSGIITTLGLMVGLQAGTNSKLAVIGGVLVIAIADAFSDALGIHVSEESKKNNSAKEIWQATIATFAFKFIFALTFVVPILIFNLSAAVIVSVLWGLLLLAAFSFYLAGQRKISAWKSIVEHLVIALAVIAITHYVGIWVGIMFK